MKTTKWLSISISVIALFLLICNIASANPTREWEYDEFGNAIYYHYLYLYTSQGDNYENESIFNWSYTYNGDEIINTEFTFEGTQIKNGILASASSGGYTLNSDYYRNNSLTKYYASDGETLASERSYYDYYSYKYEYGYWNDINTTYNTDGTKTVTSNYRSWSTGYDYSGNSTDEYDANGNIISSTYSSTSKSGEDTYVNEGSYTYDYTYNGDVVINTKQTYEGTQTKNGVLTSTSSGEYTYNSAYYRYNSLSKYYASDGQTLTSERSYYYYYSYRAKNANSIDTLTTYNTDGTKTVTSYDKSWRTGYDYRSNSTDEYNTNGNIVSRTQYSTTKYTSQDNYSENEHIYNWSYTYNGDEIINTEFTFEGTITINGVLGYATSGGQTTNSDYYRYNSVKKYYASDGQTLTSDRSYYNYYSYKYKYGYRNDINTTYNIDGTKTVITNSGNWRTGYDYSSNSTDEYDTHGNIISRIFSSTTKSGEVTYVTEYSYTYDFTYNGDVVISTKHTYEETQTKNGMLTYASSSEYTLNNDYYRYSGLSKYYASDGQTLTSERSYYYYYSYKDEYGYSYNTYTTYNTDGTKTVTSNYRSWSTGYDYRINSTNEYNTNGHIISSTSYSTSQSGEDIYISEDSYTVDYTYSGDEIINTKRTFEGTQTKNGILTSAFSGEYTYNSDYRQNNSLSKYYASDGETLTSESSYYYYYSYKYEYGNSNSIYTTYNADGTKTVTSYYRSWREGYDYRSSSTDEYDTHGNIISGTYSSTTKSGEDTYANEGSNTYEYTYSGDEIINTECAYEGTQTKNGVLTSTSSGEYTYNSDYYQSNSLNKYYASDGQTLTSERSYYYYHSYKYEWGNSDNIYTTYNSDGTKTVTSYDRRWRTGYDYRSNSTDEYDTNGNVVSGTYYSITKSGEDTYINEGSYTADYTYDGDEVINTKRTYESTTTKNGVLAVIASWESIDDGDYRRYNSVNDYYAPNGRKIKTIIIDSEHNYATGESITSQIIEEYEYYASGNFYRKVIKDPDNGFPLTIYIYYDEDFYGNGVGRLKHESTYSGPSPHAFAGAFEYTYWGDTDTVKVKEHSYGPVGHDTYEYFESGNLQKYTETWAGFTLNILTYDDVDIDGDGIGRLLEEIQGDDTGVTARFVYREHYDGSEQYRYKDEYDADDNLVVTYEYDVNGNLIGVLTKEYYTNETLKKTVENKNGVTRTIKYANDANVGDTEGRILEEIVEDSTGVIARYIYHGYHDFGYSYIRQYHYKDKYDKDGNLIAVLEYNLNGNLIAEHDKTYWNTYHESGNLASKQVFGPENGYPDTGYDFDTPGYPRTTTTYYDEDFYGNGVGRLRWESIYFGASPHAFNGSFLYIYWGDTDTVKVKEHSYGPVGHDIYEYFESGNLQKYTEIWAGFTLNILTYDDVDIDGDGIGRILEEIQGDHTGVTARFVYREHYDGSEQ